MVISVALLGQITEIRRDRFQAIVQKVLFQFQRRFLVHQGNHLVDVDVARKEINDVRTDLFRHSENSKTVQFDVFLQIEQIDFAVRRTAPRWTEINDISC